MRAQFNDDELLLRAIRPPGMLDKYKHLWKNGRPSSAAFKDRRGVSVDRTAGRSVDESVRFMASRLDGHIYTVPVEECISIGVLVKYAPMDDNVYHSEIHRDENTPELTDSQARYLSSIAIAVHTSIQDTH